MKITPTGINLQSYAYLILPCSRIILTSEKCISLHFSFSIGKDMLTWWDHSNSVKVLDFLLNQINTYALLYTYGLYSSAQLSIHFFMVNYKDIGWDMAWKGKNVQNINLFIKSSMKNNMQIFGSNSSLKEISLRVLFLKGLVNSD